ncbi:MAG: hypothetical protein ACP5NV_00735 [Candidatus Woesearchaeota archaeon]
MIKRLSWGDAFELLDDLECVYSFKVYKNNSAKFENAELLYDKSRINYEDMIIDIAGYTNSPDWKIYSKTKNDTVQDYVFVAIGNGLNDKSYMHVKICKEGFIYDVNR